jgi:sulfite reductase beta subunit-like hemoprotein
MEPTSVPHADPSTTKKPAGRGSLSDPERHDVPGHIIPIIESEFDDFDTESTKFLDGQTPEPDFIGFRLKQGVYGQRQPDVQMCRIKLPFGGVTPEQMDMFGHVVEKYAPLGKGHITTRQNVQIHHIPLMQMAELIREVSAVGLSSREGCGNTVRNVTGDPWAGVAQGEVFDTTPYIGAFVRYFVRHPTTQLMPRKVKAAFDGTPDEDRSITGIHDIAFLARVKDGVKGFEIRVGGGTSIMPRVAPTIWEFASADDGEYLKIAEAVFRIFDAQDWLRVNRARARLKVLVDRDGPEAVREMIVKELEGDWVAQRDFSVEDRVFNVDEEELAPKADPTKAYASPNGDSSEFAAFCEYNVQKQKQEGFSAVEVRIVRGDLVPEQWRGLAQIMRDYTGGLARTTVQQNLLLRWVRDESVYEVWQKLKELGLADPGVRTVLDVVSCPGTDSCKLGITSSMGLNRAVQQKVTEMGIDDPLTRQVKIKMSGCPNGCSQHHIANIGFYGASIKVGEHTIPAYVAHIAGTYEKGEVEYGTRLKVRLPAKRVPDAVERWLKMYEAEREEGEEFNAYAKRAGTKRFEDEVRDLSMPVEFGLDTMNMFMDWTKNVPFQVVRGEGECAV